MDTLLASTGSIHTDVLVVVVGMDAAMISLEMPIGMRRCLGDSGSLPTHVINGCTTTATWNREYCMIFFTGINRKK